MLMLHSCTIIVLSFLINSVFEFTKTGINAYLRKLGTINNNNDDNSNKNNIINELIAELCIYEKILLHVKPFFQHFIS